MPSRNTIKPYVENGYYHIYNRGVEKRRIFLDAQDYAVFISYLKTYLLPKNERELQETLTNPNMSYKERDRILRLLRLNNFADEITLLAYCLMPNHFHLFVKQKNANSIDKFMNSLGTRYTMYFNKKHNRVGHLYQGLYKAKFIAHEIYFLHLSRYIHKQGLISKKGKPISQPSSYKDYTGQTHTDWVKPQEILSYFSKNNPRLSYESFVVEENDPEIIQNFITHQN